MFDFNRLIENFLKRELRSKEIGKYYPSEVGGCLRKSWYSYMYPKETAADLTKIFYAGELVHEFVADVIRSDKNPDVELVACEAPFKLSFDEFVISGRIDDIILLKLQNKQVLVEVKSISYLESLAQAKDEHVMQLMIYLHALQLSDGVVLYVEKNTLKTKTFHVFYDPKRFDFILQRFRRLHHSLIEKKVPDPEGRIISTMHWMCGTCPYREECYRDTPKEILP